MSGPLFRRLQRQSPLTNFSSKLTSSVSHLSTPLFHADLPKRILDIEEPLTSGGIDRDSGYLLRIRRSLRNASIVFSRNANLAIFEGNWWSIFRTMYVRLFVFELAELVRQVNGSIANVTICQSCSRRVLYYVTNYFRFRLLVRNRVRREFCHWKRHGVTVFNDESCRATR